MLYCKGSGGIPLLLVVFGGTSLCKLLFIHYCIVFVYFSYSLVIHYCVLQ